MQNACVGPNVVQVALGCSSTSEIHPPLATILRSTILFVSSLSLLSSSFLCSARPVVFFVVGEILCEECSVDPNQTCCAAMYQAHGEAGFTVGAQVLCGLRLRKKIGVQKRHGIGDELGQTASESMSRPEMRLLRGRKTLRWRGSPLVPV